MAQIHIASDHFAVGKRWNVYRGHRIIPFAADPEQIIAKVLRVPGDPALVDRLTARQNQQQALSHPNVALDTLTFREGLSMLIGLYHSAGSVVQYIRQGGAPTVGEKIKILTDIARGLEYLHSRGVVHGQVWGDNVLINDSGGAMLSDAGVRAAVPHVTYDWDRVFWQAPETVEADNDNAPQTSMAADVYALACTAKEIFTSRRPFCGVRNPQLFLVQLSAGQIMDEERFGGIPPAVVNALRGCWDTDPATRPSAATVFRRLDEIQT